MSEVGRSMRGRDDAGAAMWQDTIATSTPRSTLFSQISVKSGRMRPGNVRKLGPVPALNAVMEAKEGRALDQGHATCGNADSHSARGMSGSAAAVLLGTSTWGTNASCSLPSSARAAPRGTEDALPLQGLPTNMQNHVDMLGNPGMGPTARSKNGHSGCASSQGNPCAQLESRSTGAATQGIAGRQSSSTSPTASEVRRPLRAKLSGAGSMLAGEAGVLRAAPASGPGAGCQPHGRGEATAGVPGAGAGAGQALRGAAIVESPSKRGATRAREDTALILAGRHRVAGSQDVLQELGAEGALQQDTAWKTNSASQAEDLSAASLRRKAPVEIANLCEFRPSSRSSSESASAVGTPNAADAMTRRTFSRPRASDHCSADAAAVATGAAKQDNAESSSRPTMVKRRTGGQSRDRGVSVSSSITSNRASVSTCYVNFDKFDLQIENGQAPKQMLSWDQLLSIARSDDLPTAGLDEDADFLRQAIDWYGWQAPTKFQAVAVPCIIQACRNVPDARSYTLLQAAGGLGKTSALALGLLCSMRRKVENLQFIIVATDGCEDIERYFNSLGCLFSAKAVYFKEAISEDMEADVAASKGAQVLVGHPTRVSAVLKAAQDQLSLTDVDVLLIDDAAEVIAEGLVPKVCEINQLLSLFVRNPLRYIILSNFVEREAKPALRALKSSLMSKKNMFDLSQQVGRIRKFVKHYSMELDPKEWFRMLVKMREMIYIPRAVIFCDHEGRFQNLKKSFMTEHVRDQDGKIMSLAVNDNQSQTQSQRHEQFKAFCKEQHDFLLTRSEPNIFQTSLPRVFWIIHFGVESSNLPWYGCRLLCLDSQLRQKSCKDAHHDGVSILFTSPKESDTAPKLEKMFGIKFEGLPLGPLV